MLHPTVKHYLDRLAEKKVSESIDDIQAQLPKWATNENADPNWGAYEAAHMYRHTLRSAFQSWTDDELAVAYWHLCDEAFPSHPTRTPKSKAQTAAGLARENGDEQLARLWELWSCETTLISYEIKWRGRG